MSGVQGATHVYVCTTEYGVKIGASRNVPQRMKWLKGLLVQKWHRPNDAQTIEYNALRLVGVKATKGSECFDVPVAQAIAAVESAIAQVDAGTAGPSARMQTLERQERQMRQFSDRMAAAMQEMKLEWEKAERDGWYWDDEAKRVRRREAPEQQTEER